jgi:H+/Cl- antiporter ClcA
VMSVVFTRLVAWFTRTFGFMNDHLGIPTSVTPAIGALFTGVIALRYPGVLYWGFTATAPGQGLLAQLTVAKIVATAMCKGSGLVGGLYAPSLFIGSAAGALYGSIIGQAMNTVLPGHNAVAHPQAYALVSATSVRCFASCFLRLVPWTLHRLTVLYPFLSCFQRNFGVVLIMARVMSDSWYDLDL